MSSKIIAVDFDGTCVTHKYPEVGADIGAAEVLRALVNEGHKIILWTMRDHRLHGDVDGSQVDQISTTHDCLQEAVNWFKQNDIPLWGINENPEQSWSDSNKAYADLYIDDAALGCPLAGGHVDWKSVATNLMSLKLLPVSVVSELFNSLEWLKKTVYGTEN